MAGQNGIVSVELEGLFLHLGKKGFMKVQESRMPVLSTSLHYGDAIFEGMSLFEKGGRIGLFHPSLNFERMRYGAEQLLFGFPEISDEELVSVIFRLVLLNGWGKGLPESTNVMKAGKTVRRAYVRNLLFSDSNGVGVGTPVEPEMLTVVAPIGNYFDSEAEEVNLLLFPEPRRVAFPTLKGSGNYQLGMYSKRFLAGFNRKSRMKCYETLFLNERGNIAEGSAENIMVLQGDELVTPSPSEGVLMGISLRIISGIAQEEGLRFRMGKVTMEDVEKCDGMFMCGNAAGILPVDRILEVDREGSTRKVTEIPASGNGRLMEIKRKYEETELWERGEGYHTFLDEWFPDGNADGEHAVPERFGRDSERMKKEFGICRYLH